MRNTTGFYFSLDDEVIGILYLSVLKSVLESRGYKLRGYPGHLSDLNDFRKRISPKIFYQVLICSLEGVPGGLGFSYGKQLNLVAADTVGQLIMSCSNLMQALQYLQRFHLLLSVSLNIEPDLDGNSATIRFDRLYHRSLPLFLQWFATETLYSCCLYQSRWLTGSSLNYQTVKLPYSCPPHGNLYQSTLACDVEFESSCHEAILNKETLNLPIITANKQVLKIKAQQCQSVLARWEGRFSIQARVNTILAQTYPDFPSIEQVARQLNTSRSCLYRKLHDKQTNYQTLVNHFKKEKAISLLRGSLLTVSDIAEQLGFSDASSFRRAFKSWTGVQPSSIREERRGRRHDESLVRQA